MERSYPIRQTETGITSAEKISKRKDSSDVMVGETSNKKRKRHIDAINKADRRQKYLTESAKVETADETRRKKRRNNTGFPDPDDDPSLPEQLRKSLVYAFCQFHRPSKWKFNKARQNWLIRNIWSKETIPDIYIPLVMKYLAKMQGGVRKNLLDSCKVILEFPKSAVLEASTADASNPALVTPTPPSDIDNVKKARAQALLDILGPSETALDS